MNRHTLTALLLLLNTTCLVIAGDRVSQTRQQMPVVVVMDFVDRSKERHTHLWIGEALSELLTSNLSDARDLAVVDRENLDTHYAEMDLSRTGLVSTDSAAKFGRMVMASHVVVGSFSVNGRSVSINARIVSLESGGVCGQANAVGRVDQVMGLEATIAREILKTLSNQAPEVDRELVAPATEIPVEAIQAYYLGRMAMRNSELESALGFMTAAVRASSSYPEPYSALVLIYRGMKMNDHAAKAAEDLMTCFPNHEHSFREMYHKAETLRKAGQRGEALALYQHIIDNSADIYASGAWCGYAELGTRTVSDRNEAYRKALAVRPDIGLFKKEILAKLVEAGGVTRELARELCFSPVLEVRRMAYKAIVKGEDRKWIEVLYERYCSNEYGSSDRGHIASVLLEYGGLEDWMRLLEAATDGHATYFNGLRLIKNFQRLKHEPALDLLPDLLLSMADKERSWAIGRLQGWNHPKVASAIRTVLQSPCRFRTRIAACKTLAALNDRQAIPLLLPFLDDPYYLKEMQTFPVRRAAYQALRKLGHKVKQPQLEGKGFAAPTFDSVAHGQGFQRRAHPYVGIILSQNNAECRNSSSSARDGYGYGVSFNAMKAISVGHYPCLMYYNPWRDRSNDRFKHYLKKNQRDGEPILSATSIEDLKMADAVVVAGVYNVEPEVVSVLDEYVRGGGGLVVISGFGLLGIRGSVYYKLMGFPHGKSKHVWWSSKNSVEFIAMEEHPLTAGMPLGVPMPYGPGWRCGLSFDSALFSDTAHTVLLRTTNPDTDAVVVREHGEGRIVIINWSLSGSRNRIGPLNGPEFICRAADWAGRVDEKYPDMCAGKSDPSLGDWPRKWFASYADRRREQWSETVEAKERVDVAVSTSNTATDEQPLDTVAVMPFMNMTGDATLSDLADSIAPVLGSVLESSAGLLQLERQEIDKVLQEQNLSLAGMQNADTAIKVGKMLGVKYLLFSALLKKDGDMVLSSRLQDVTTTVVFASAEARGATTNIFPVLESIAQQLAGKMDRNRTEFSLPRDGTPLANLHYMKGVGHRCSGDLGRALSELMIACRYAPKHAKAVLLLERVYAEMGMQEYSNLELPENILVTLARTQSPLLPNEVDETRLGHDKVVVMQDIDTSNGVPVVNLRKGLKRIGEYEGEYGVLRTHPFTRSRPSILDFSAVSKHQRGTLVLHLRNSPKHDCVAVIKRDGATYAKTTVAGDRWGRLEVPFDHQTLLLEGHAGGPECIWHDEWMNLTYRIDAGSVDRE